MNAKQDSLLFAPRATWCLEEAPRFECVSADNGMQSFVQSWPVACFEVSERLPGMCRMGSLRGALVCYHMQCGEGGCVTSHAFVCPLFQISLVGSSSFDAVRWTFECIAHVEPSCRSHG